MGSESSVENTPTNDYLNKLLTFDYTEDYHFWYEYLKNSPNRLSRPAPSTENQNELGSEVVPPDARFIYELADRKSKNFENFILTSIKEITDASKAIETRSNTEDDDTSNDNYDLTNEQNLNALHFALTTLPTALTLLLKDKKLASSLAFLDSNVFDEVVKIFPEASEFSKRKKKQKKIKKNEKTQSTQPKSTENEKNENEEEDKDDDEEKETEVDSANQTQNITPQKKKKKLSPEKQLKRDERLHYLRMRRQRGSIFSLLTENLINLLFKPGLTISINKSNQGEKNGFWCHSSFRVDQIRYDIVHCLIFLSSIIDSSRIYELKNPVTSYIESFSNRGNEFPLTQFLISITNMEFATSNSRHEPIADRLLQNCIALVISMFQFSSFKENLKSIDARTLARVFFAPKKVEKSSKDDQNNENKFDRLFGHFLIKSPNKFYVEWISLLFISFFSNQTFLKQVTRSPSASKEIIEFILSQPVVDQGATKVSYIHSVILTTLLFILQNAPIPPEILQQLKDAKAKNENNSKSETDTKINSNESNSKSETATKINSNESNSKDLNAKEDEKNKKETKEEKAKRKKEMKLEFKKKFYITYLDDPFAPSSQRANPNVKLDDDDSCLGDFIVNKLLNFCRTETFLPSFICALHLIVPHITDFTLETALNIFNLYEKCSPEIKNQFIDIFATVVQIPKRHSSIKTVILMKSNLFKSSVLSNPVSQPPKKSSTKESAKNSAQNKKKSINDDDDDDDSYDDEYDEYEVDDDDEEEEAAKSEQKNTVTTSEQIVIIHKFISMSKKILLKKVSGNEQKTMDIMKIADVMCRMNIKLRRRFPNRKSFLKHPVTNGSEIEKSWSDWSVLICKKTSLQELKSLRKLADSQV